MSDPFTLPPALRAQAAEAERLAQSGHVGAAAQLHQRVLAACPGYSRSLSFLALQALQDNNLAEARRLIDLAAAGEPKIALVEANRALILREQGDLEGALEALQSAIERDPNFLPAMLDAGQLLDELGRPHEAAVQFRLALSKCPPASSLPPPLQQRVDAAQRFVDREQQALAAAIDARLAPLRGDGETRERFEECLDIFLGRAKPKQPKPGMMFFPKLTPLTFFPRQMFDWLERIESATDAIRREIEAVMAGGEGGFIPYVQKPEAEHGPGSVWNPLNHNRDWGAYFLFNHGKRVERHCQACPVTAGVLDELPLVRIPRRGPTAFFSRLKPRTHIPPHHGATNTRLVAHLPLIVPPGCGIRVGNDRREWIPGQMLIFDDTIEHEAWNHGEDTRVVLIFDVWNPLLDEHERAMVTETTAAIAEFFPGDLHDTDT